MKKIVSILILLLFVYNSAGFILVYLSYKPTVKNEAREKVSKIDHEDASDLFVVANDTEPPFEIEDEGKEIRHNDHLYDIIKIENRNDSVYYYCIRDDKENKLNEHFTANVESQSSNEKSSQKHDIIKLIKIFDCTGFPLKHSESEIYFTKLNLSSSTIKFLPSVILSTLKPPPRV